MKDDSSTQGRTRRQNFDAYYKANPDKLKGRSLDEAYAAMQRQATRNSAPDRKSGMAPAVVNRQAAIQRRIQSKPSTVTDSGTPYEKLNSRIDNFNNNTAQPLLDKTHNKLAKFIKNRSHGNL